MWAKPRITLWLNLFLFFFAATTCLAVELYVDEKTKQVYTEPGENRIKLNGKPAPKGDTDADKDKKKKVIGTVDVDGVTLDVNGLPAGDARAKWYDKLNIRGYMQFRYNDAIGGQQHDLIHYGDGSVGDNKSFFIRRMRVILFGDVSEHVYFYLQPDFASTPSGFSSNNALTGHFGQLRDAYFDFSFDEKKEFRLRFGQSKIPFGFENMQSSQNRLALDRNDAINSCCKDERDIGVYFYWAPAEIRHRFRDLVSSGLKGSGDYGVFALGAYNGQGANRGDRNDQFHLVSRLTYPFLLPSGQFVEASIQGYRGKFQLPTTSTLVQKMDDQLGGFKDERVALSFVYYPQPLGFQAEWNWGHGPRISPDRRSIVEGDLSGGYFQTMYKKDNVFMKGDALIPFFKYQQMDGGMKFEGAAEYQVLREKEFGIEYQPWKALEVVTELVDTSRVNVGNGHVADATIFRVQIQLNY